MPGGRVNKSNNIADEGSGSSSSSSSSSSSVNENSNRVKLRPKRAVLPLWMKLRMRI